MVLNRRTVRGDHCLLFYLLALSSLVYFSRFFPRYLELSSVIRITVVYFGSLLVATVSYRLSPFHPLAEYPGPVIWRVSSLVLVTVSYGGKRHLVLQKLHGKYGKIVRICRPPSFFALIIRPLPSVIERSKYIVC